MKRVVTVVVLYGFLFVLVKSCTPFQKKEEPKREKDIVDKQLFNVVLQSHLGENVETRAYDTKHYASQKGGPVDGGDDLGCDFESDCCWTDNVKNQKRRRVDWIVADGVSDLGSFERTFGQKERPNGRFLAAVSPFSDPTLRAEFVSCDVVCTDQEVIVSFRHWTTPNVKLQICVQDALVLGKKRSVAEKCEDVPSRLSPGPTAMTLPPRDYFVIKLVASNFTDKGGGMAALDDITITAAPCQRQPQLITPQRRGKEKSTDKKKESSSKSKNEKSSSKSKKDKLDIASQRLTCDFEGGTCGYVDANGRIGNRAMHFLHGRIGTGSSGVQGVAKGNSYVGAVLRPGDVVALEASNLVIPESLALQLHSFSTSPSITIKACLGDMNHCLPQGINGTGDGWRMSEVQVPARTNTVLFIASNGGSTPGTMGIDDITVVKGGGDNE